jgi:hypothetical protein
MFQILHYMRHSLGVHQNGIVQCLCLTTYTTPTVKDEPLSQGPVNIHSPYDPQIPNHAQSATLPIRLRTTPAAQ